jgi:hypothetical protein
VRTSKNHLYKNTCPSSQTCHEILCTFWTCSEVLYMGTVLASCISDTLLESALLEPVCPQFCVTETVLKSCVPELVLKSLFVYWDVSLEPCALRPFLMFCALVPVLRSCVLYCDILGPVLKFCVLRPVLCAETCPEILHSWTLSPVHWDMFFVPGTRTCPIVLCTWMCHEVLCTGICS